MSDTQIIKAEKDFSKDADKLIPEAESLAQVPYILVTISPGFVY